MFLRRRRTAEDFRQEIEAHIAAETDRLMAEGLKAKEARAAALRTFGNVTRVRERYYESGRAVWLQDASRISVTPGVHSCGTPAFRWQRY